MSRKIFVRDATGLVRNISMWDAFFASFGFVALPLAFVTYTTGPFLFPGCDLVLATILTTLLSIPIVLMFTLFSWAMPRSGGDYVFVSRVLHPLLGMMSSVNMAFYLIFFIGFELNWVMTLAVSPSLLIIGTVTSNQALISLAASMSQPQNAALVGLLIVIIFTIVLLMGTKVSFLLSNLLVLVSLAGVAIAIGLLIAGSNAAFANSFSRFGSYTGIIASAHQQGYSPQGPLIASLGLMPFIYLTTGWAFATSYYSGEIKSVKKNLFYSQVLVSVTAGILLTIIAALAVRDFGYDFLGSISYLQGTGASQYPFGTLTPYINLFLSMLTDNPIIMWLLGISFVAALFAAFLPSLMATSRIVFAWAFDRVIPAKFAEVHERLHVPVYTITAMVIIWAASMIGYTYGPSYFLVLYAGATLGELFSLILISITAIVFPFRRKDIYEPSPAKINLGPAPLISIAGVISLAFFVMLAYLLVSNPIYGANTPSVAAFVIIIFLIGAPIYIISYYYHRSKGLDISLVFKEIPPE